MSNSAISHFVPCRRNAAPAVIGLSTSSRRVGFTLVELLVVIAVMGILGTIVLGSSRMLIRTARERRAKVTRDALNVALHRYRTEYQHWPVSKKDSRANLPGNENDDERKRRGTDAYNGEDWYRWDVDNYKIFDALRVGNKSRDMNPDDIRFIDESATLGSDGNREDGAVSPLSQLNGTTGHSLFYGMRRDNKAAPFAVWICFATDEAEVGFYNKNAGGEYKNKENMKDGAESEDEEDKAYGY